MNHHIGPEERRQMELAKAVRARLFKPEKRRRLTNAQCPTLDIVEIKPEPDVIFLIDHNAHVIDRYRFLLGENQVDRTTATEIMKRIAKETGITIAEMKGTRRFRTVANARQRAMAEVADTCYWLSLSQIGRIFKKDHTTVLHAMSKFGVKRTNTYHKNKQAA